MRDNKDKDNKTKTMTNTTQIQPREELGDATRWVEMSCGGDNKDKDKKKQKQRQRQRQIQRQSRSDKSKNWVAQGDGGRLSQWARQQRALEALAVADNLSK